MEDLEEGKWCYLALFYKALYVCVRDRLYPPGPRFDPVAPFGPGSHPDWPSGGRGGRMGGR